MAVTVAMLTGGVEGAGGAAGGAAGGGGKELGAEGGDGFCTELGAVAVWFRFWFSFCAREVDEVAGLPPDLGATAGALVNC